MNFLNSSQGVFSAWTEELWADGRDFSDFGDDTNCRTSHSNANDGVDRNEIISVEEWPQPRSIGNILVEKIDKTFESTCGPGTQSRRITAIASHGMEHPTMAPRDTFARLNMDDTALPRQSVDVNQGVSASMSTVVEGQEMHPSAATMKVARLQGAKVTATQRSNPQGTWPRQASGIGASTVRFVARYVRRYSLFHLSQSSNSRMSDAFLLKIL
jgi:hypothetical protein